LKVTIAQLNPIVGDIQGNSGRITGLLSELAGEAPDLVVFPELFLVGYPPRDLLERPWFVQRAQAAVQDLARASADYPQTGLLLGAPWPTGKDTGKGLYNSAILLYQGEVVFVQHKSLLPTYDVFDEARYFDVAPEVHAVPFKDEVLGISICEDAWNTPELWPRQRPYSFDPVQALAEEGATLFINISASPFYKGKERIRYDLIRAHARTHGVPFVYANQIGANDELVFDGKSFCLDERGDPIADFPSFQEHVRTIETSAAGTPGAYVPQDEIASVYEALVLGIRDYMSKCGFSKAVIGLSGGIDSAVTCCLATAALGSENVLAMSMPSQFSSRGSVEDSREVAANLGARFEVVPISDVFQAYRATLGELLEGEEIGVAEENLQARVRGNLLMAMSNEYGYLLLATGNKSEMAVGYCTLYGDMSGGLSVISDVPKTMVYELAEHINREATIIPRAVFDKAPSAELRPNQTDQDTLPPYPILDQIIHYYVEEQYSADEIIAEGFEPETVRWVVRTINRNEYKRRQAAPGLKVTSKAFGVGRRIPIAARYDC